MAKRTTSVQASIRENSDKIEIAKKAISKKSKTLCDTDIVIEDLANEDWRNKTFAFPSHTIRLATVFSGIGAIEHAFQRLKLSCDIVFAGDIDDKCKASYFANYNIAEENWFSDIRV